MSQDKYIFGYGSLVSPKDIERTLGHPPTTIELGSLTGWVRDWGVILDNTTTIRRYEMLPNHEVPQYVSILNIRQPAEGELATNPNGVLFAVTDEDIEKMDNRENHYERRDITDEIVSNIQGRVYAYVGLEQFLGNSLLESKSIVPKSYRDLVEAGFASFGTDCLETFRLSTLPTSVIEVPTVHTSNI